MKTRKFRVFSVVIIASWIVMQIGLYIGWPSPVMDTLTEGNGPLAEPATDDQISWMVAALDLGNVLSPLPCYYLADRWGRKPLLVILGPMSVFGWIIIYLGTNMTYLYIGRLLQGFHCGIGSFMVPLYLSEISEPKFRGAITTISAAALNVGILIAYTTGPFVSYETLNILCTFLSAIYAVAVFYLPETPYYHLMRKNVEKAESFLRWAREDYNEDELVKMKENVDSEMKRSGWHGIFSQRHERVAFLTVFFMYVVTALTFYWSIPAYATRTFATITSVVTPGQFTILLGVCMLVGTFPAIYFIDRLGRKKITIISALLTAIFAFLAAGYLFISERKLFDAAAYSWSICVFTAGLLCSASLSIGQMFFILQGEYFPSNSRALAAALVQSFGSIFGILSDKGYLLIADNLGMYVNFIFCGCVALACFFFACFWMLETKDKTFAEIQLLFSERAYGKGKTRPVNS